MGNDTDPYLLQNVYFTNPSNPGFGNNIANLEFPYTNRISGVAVNAQTYNNYLKNAELKPEFTTELEVGADLQFLNNRIGIDFTWYTRSSKDQIVPIDVAPSTGFTSKYVNIGEVTNTGTETALRLVPFQSPTGFNWEIYTIFSQNTNEVVSLAEGLDEVFVNGYGNSLKIVHREGEPYGQIKGSVAAKHTDGSLLVDPSTGKLIEETELQVIGDPNPKFILGVTNTFRWKGISLNVLVDYKHGGQIWSGTYNQVFGRGLTTETIPDHPDGRAIAVVIPGVVGDPATFEAVLDENGNTIPNGTLLTVNDWYFINTFGSAGPNEFSLFDATVIRLREITLGYDLPTSLLQKTPFGSINVSLTGRNLWYNAVNMPKSLNFEPETSSLGAGNVDGLDPYLTGNAQGIDFGIVPTTRRYGVNLRVTF